MITKITCRYSFEVLDFHGNDFGFTFNIGVSYLGIYKTSMIQTKSGIKLRNMLMNTGQQALNENLKGIFLRSVNPRFGVG